MGDPIQQNIAFLPGSQYGNKLRFSYLAQAHSFSHRDAIVGVKLSFFSDFLRLITNYSVQLQSITKACHGRWCPAGVHFILYDINKYVQHNELNKKQRFLLKSIPHITNIRSSHSITFTLPNTYTDSNFYYLYIQLI